MADYCYWNNENRLQKEEQEKFCNSFYIAPFWTVIIVLFKLQNIGTISFMNKSSKWYF